MRKTIFVRTLSCGISLFCLVALCMMHLSAFGQSEAPVAMPKDAKALMLQAANANSLVGDDLQPWHLRATWKLLDEQGNVTDQGTFEEYWVSSKKFKRTVIGTDFKDSIYGTENGVLFSTPKNPLPLPLTQLRFQNLGSMPNLESIERFSFVLKKREVGSIKFDCLSLKDANAVGPFWCLDLDMPILRVSSRAPGTQVDHNNIASFQNRYIAKDLQFTRQGKPFLIAHLDRIELLTTIDESVFQPVPDAAAKLRKISISGGVMVGMLAKKVDPVYPPIALAAHVQGSVVLQAVIGTNGRIENLRVISGPAMLQQAALDAVKQWVYKPYSLDGEPVEVETQINVVFMLPPQWR
jgi:TonB family protein